MTCLTLLALAPARADDEFETKIRPLLVEHCLDCHGPDLQESGLRVDHISFLKKGGERGPAVDATRPDASRFLQVISYEDVNLQMPPEGKLPQEALDRLSAWIRQGAPWPDEPPPEERAAVEAFDLAGRKAAHWCWKPLQRPELPAGISPDMGPIDRFVMARLAERGLQPLPPADRRSLIRRASFDLIGLPPTKAEIDAFLADRAPDAFARVVDRLLESPHFGERWARHWMDLVRYAETYGHEFDYPVPHAFEYRDYLIRAFNADVPYDQFVREHIAGDLLADPRIHPVDGTNESIIATAFWFFHEQTHAPVDVRQHQADRIDNQIDTMGKTFLGLTLGCARCHDHKFDAISTEDVYALWGYLKSSRPQEIELDPGGKIGDLVRRMTAERRRGNELLSATESSSGRVVYSAVQIAKYLSAAGEALYGVGDDASTETPLVFADFESPTYEGWTVEGTAFGEQPQTFRTIASYQGDVKARGNGLVNSHNIRDGGDVRSGDEHTGTLTSRVFEIEFPFIQFLVGGGRHPQRTCIELSVDGKVVREQTGQNSNEMFAAEWDVRDLIGKQAVLRIVDHEKGGWGNIGVDDIVFSHVSLAGEKLKRPASKIAETHRLDLAILNRWIAELAAAKEKGPSHPLYAAAELFAVAMATPESFNANKARLQAQYQQASAPPPGQEVFEDFENGSWDGWYVSGSAFGDRPTGPGEWDSSRPRGAFAAAGVAHSGQLSPRFTGAIRSRTFTITKPFVHYRLAGKKSRVRLVVDTYVMDIHSSLLFADLNFEVDSEELTWRVQSGDLSRYLGHEAYIEIVDGGDGWIAVDEIRFADTATPAVEADELTGRLLNAESVTTVASLADAYGAALAAAVSQPAESSAGWARWATERDLLGVDHRPFEHLRHHLDEMASSLPPARRVLAMADGNGVEQAIYIRGKHQSPGKLAPRRFLEAIAGASQSPAPEDSSGRLELAEQILAEGNPLTARVIVNRVWHHLFGRGIVATVDNFGAQGKEPTHPELLDWLADSFRDEWNWSVKRLIREIVLSDTYQRASFPVSPELERLDPENLLLGRASPRRLEGEAIRDAILAISGNLNETMYGPAVPVHLTPFMSGRGKPESGPLDGNGRRSVYVSVKRNFLPPMMLAFDTPIPFQTVGQRTVSNVPAQSLILMNDPFVVTEARRWAEKIMDLPESERIAEMYVAAFARLPTSDEAAAARQFLSMQQREYASMTDQATKELAVWSDLAHALWNVKEFIYLQ